MGKKMRQAIALGKKLAEVRQDEPCSACGGSGRYDVAGSPKCSACNGTGRQQKRTFAVPCTNELAVPPLGTLARLQAAIDQADAEYEAASARVFSKLK